MAWNMGKIKAQLEAPTFNKDEGCQGSACRGRRCQWAWSAVPAGNRQGHWLKETRLKSEFFQQQDEVKKLATAFNQAANELDKVAQTGD